MSEELLESMSILYKEGNMCKRNIEIIKQAKKYIEQLEKEIDTLKKENDKLEDFNEEIMEERNILHSIIKEVREILKFHLSNPSGTKNGWHIDIWNSEDISKLNEHLGILDKENI